MLKIPNPTWAAHGLCAQTDPEAFFPEKGGSAAHAKKICNQCPVTTHCLNHALTHNENHGIWGGHSPQERQRLQQHHPKPQHEDWHGTRAGARRHQRQGTAICNDCRHANNAYERNYRQQRKLTP